MSDASTKQSVECPICGDEFDPTVAGGWCTNTECGEWQYTEGSNESDVAEADAESTAEETDDDGFVSPAQETEEPESVDLFGDDEEPSDEGEADAAEDPDEVEEAVDEEESEADHDEVEEDVDEEESEADHDEVEEDVDETEADTVDCPDCGVELDTEVNFCAECGADVSDVTPTEETLDACPGCGNDVDDDDNFCVSCGEDLDAHRESDEDAVDALDADDSDGSHETLVLEVEGREITVEDGDTVGREIRAALTDAGRPDDEAVRIHREHVRFVREEGSYYLLDLGDNPTQINGQTLQKGDREAVAPGDELELSGVASVTVQTP